MADEYIRRAEALEITTRTCGDYAAAFAEIRKLPAADVAPVRRGQMLVLDECSNSGIYCTACKCRIHREDFAYKILRAKYCPNCGAKMDGGNGDATD